MIARPRSGAHLSLLGFPLSPCVLDAPHLSVRGKTRLSLDRPGRECDSQVVRRILAFALALVLIVGVAVPAAQAGGRTATNVALGLASFAVFNQLFSPLAFARPVFVAPVVYAAPVYVAQPIYYQRAYVAPPAVVQAPPTYPTVVQYAHGRYELRGDGIQMPYQWVWIPNPPPSPPPPAAAPAPPSAPSR